MSPQRPARAPPSRPGTHGSCPVEATNLPAGSAWRWTTHFTVPAAPAGSNGWQLKVFVKNQSSAQLFVDGLTTAVRRVNIAQYGVAAGGIGGSTIAAWDGLAQTAKSHDGQEYQQAAFVATFAAGETHELDLRAYANATDPLSVRFAWVPPDWQAQSIAAAVAAASSAKKVVLFAYDDGTEGVDRGGDDQNAGLALPGYQDALISAVAAANPNTVVVLNTGDPVYMPWLASVKSVLEMWYPGQAAGLATADVLMGKVNPSGKLPISFPDGSAARPRFPTDDPGCNTAAIVIPNNNTGLGAGDGNCPLYPGVFTGGHTYRTVDYTANGILQGYRWYDKHGVAPLFAFGHGLSYTTFAYSGLALTPRFDGTVDVAFDVKNTGAVKGDEVPQVYVGAGPAIAGVEQAVRALRGFDRVSLNPGETKHVTITLGRRSFQYWSTAKHAWTSNYGPRTIWVGSSSTNLALSGQTAPIAASTSQDGSVGGTVAATLSLALGAPASFGAFTPGVSRDYTATTTGTVISTAGDAALSVSDPSPIATGHLVNGAFSLPSALLAGGNPLPTVVKTYSAPVSNDAAAITFTQHIGANDALRTGSYSKTLTFTLSTTTP